MTEAEAPVAELLPVACDLAYGLAEGYESFVERSQAISTATPAELADVADELASVARRIADAATRRTL